MDTSYLAQQVTTIIGQLHGLFDEIGVPSHERDSREAELFSALSETLHNQLKTVTNEKHELTEEARRLARTIHQMEVSLEDVKAQSQYELDDTDAKISFPLTRCIQGLKEKYNVVHKLHKERLEQVRKLVEALDSYSAHLEPSFVKIKLPPLAADAAVPPTFDLSPSYLDSVEAEFNRVYQEYERRLDLVRTLCDEIIKLWAELGTPQAQTDASIVKYARDAPEQLGLHADDLDRLKARKDKLVKEKRDRESRLKELRSTIEGLWDKLGIEEVERKQFISSNRGCGLRSINEFESELARLNELKRQNLHVFVEDARYKLQELWDALYFSEEEMLDFTPAFSDVYSDALLSAHENEIARLEALKEQRAPTLALIDRHRSLVKERDDLAASSQDASRLMARGNKGEKRDPGKLLREEKMRKRIAKELPKLEADLVKVLERWEDEYGRPFTVHGDAYLDAIAAAQATAKPAPSRAKTPSAAPPPRSKTPAATAPASKPSASRSGATSRPGTVRGGGPPPARSKTPVTGHMLAASSSRHALNSSIALSASTHTHTTSHAQSQSANKSPSRLPTARPALKNMQYGGNSPERKVEDEQTIRKMPPPRAPPPRMKDLFVPPPKETPSREYEDEEGEPRSASIVRQGVMEDPYDEGRSYYSSTIRGQHPHQQQQQAHDPYARPAPPSSHYSYSSTSSGSAYPQSNASTTYHHSAGSRQISNSSNNSNNTLNTNVTTVSGSENWETYGEEESEVEAEYYAKMRMRMGAKRGTPEGDSMMASKRVKSGTGGGIRGVQEERVVDEHGRLVSGSEAGWEDEEVY